MLVLLSLSSGANWQRTAGPVNGPTTTPRRGLRVILPFSLLPNHLAHSPLTDSSGFSADNVMGPYLEHKRVDGLIDCQAQGS